MKKALLLNLILVFPLIAFSQKMVFQEGFENIKLQPSLTIVSNNENLQYTKGGSQVANLSPVADQNSVYIIPAIDISEGMAFLTFRHKQQMSSINYKNGLKVYYRSDSASPWTLLASFTNSEDIWKNETLFLPENTSAYSIRFEGNGKNRNNILLDNIRVDTYKNDYAYSEGNDIFIDTINNISPTLFKIKVSENQISGLPIVNDAMTQNRTQNVPVSCPSGAIIEGEPDCYTNYVDNFNGGCAGTPDVFTQLNSCNGTVCGKAGTFTLNSVDNRDVDTYMIQLPGPASTSMKVVADFPVKIFIIYFAYGCDGPSFSTTTTANNAGDTAILNYAIPYASSVVFWVAPKYFTGVPCGSNYVMIYKTVANISNPSTPIAANNPSCAPTQLNPMTPVTNYSFYWQGTSCGASTANPATIAYPVTSTGVYYVRGKYTPLGCWTSCSSVNVTVNLHPTIHVKAFEEGLYIGGGLMRETTDFNPISEDFAPKWGVGIADTVTVVLYDATYNNIVKRYPGIAIHTDGTIVIQDQNSCLSGSYYITIFPRNSVPVTTALPQSLATGTVNYDFTYPVNQAYGAGLDPQKDLGDGFYGMYAGELDHDAYYTIDGSDVTILDPDIIYGPYGYLRTDLNGDGVVDGSDMSIMDANAIFGPLFWNPHLVKIHLIINQNK
jgi:hypothetical protein